MTRMASILAAAALCASPGFAQSKNKLTPEERLELVRGMTAEYATAKVMLPKAKRPLPVNQVGRAVQQDKWDKAAQELGPAAKPGDAIQITRIDVNDDTILLEINGGLKSGTRWFDRVQIGMGSSGQTAPVTKSGQATEGTALTVEFRDGVPAMTAMEFKKLLQPLMDFDKRSATEDYLENLPEPIRMAIKDKRAVEGMSREQVLSAVGHPRHKTRETKEGVEAEDWVYGLPPGKITFVTFEGDLVVKVRDTYAGLGGSTAPKLDPN
jgi:hypothetical protein